MSLYAYYHYYNADASKLDELAKFNIYEADSKDAITGLFVDEESDDNDLDIISVKYINDAIPLPQLKELFEKLENSVYQFFFKKFEVRQALYNALSTEECKIDSKRPVKIKLLTDFVPKAAQRKQMLTSLGRLKPMHAQVSYEIVFGNDVENEILEVENPKEYVSVGVLKTDKVGNFVKFGNENSTILNVSAFSLKKLYEENAFRGLFAQNLRYYVKNAKVDNGIIDTINDNPGNFWYFNNGIIIICDDYSINGTTLTLNNFSIVNGGQTTKLIGETDFDKDFYLQCKVIRSNGFEGQAKIEFIAGVAEASNTQKPIKTKDLIANRKEQRMLKQQLAEYGIYCQIKRGEKINKKVYPEPWQNTTNEELGQFLLAFAYQKPGAARANKASICGNDERYNLIFSKVYNNAFIKDLMQIKAYYKKWVTKESKALMSIPADERDAYKDGLLKNGLFFEVAIIGVLAKMYFHKDYVGRLQRAVTVEQKIEILSQHDIDHAIFDQCENLEENLYELFEHCYSEYYRTAYSNMTMMEPGKSRNYSNFSKTDKNYAVYSLSNVFNRFANGISEREMEILDSIFYQPTDEEKLRDAAMLSKYVNVTDASGKNADNVNEELRGRIEEALQNYRTRKHKALKKKPFEIYNNATRDRIAANAPKNLSELQELKCLSEEQMAAFGKDIVEIVKKAIAAAK